MPIDVGQPFRDTLTDQQTVASPVDQVKNAMTGLDDESLVNSLNDIIQKASESTNAMGALEGIIRSLTSDGKPLNDQLVKLVACFAQYRIIVNDSSDVSAGFKSSLSDIAAPADVVSSSMSRLATSVKDAAGAMSGSKMSIDLGASVKEMDAAMLKMKALSDELKKLQDLSTKPINVTIREQREQIGGTGKESGGARRETAGETKTVETKKITGQKFAKGGTVHYSGRNSASMSSTSRIDSGSEAFSV